MAQSVPHYPEKFFGGELGLRVDQIPPYFPEIVAPICPEKLATLYPEKFGSGYQEPEMVTIASEVPDRLEKTGLELETVQSKCSSNQSLETELLSVNAGQRTAEISSKRRKLSDCSISRTKSDDSSLTDSQEIPLPLSQTSNWSTSSENPPDKFSSAEHKTSEISKISHLFHSIGFTLPDSLKVIVDPSASSKILNQQVYDLAQLFGKLTQL